MLKKQTKIKNFILRYRFIIISIVIIGILAYLNNSVWKPMISKERLKIDQQAKNTELLKQREESKLKLTSSGAYFLPKGDKSLDQNNKDTSKKKGSKKASKRGSDTPVKKATNEIAQKIEYLHRRIIRMEKDTHEIEFNDIGKSPFAPIDTGTDDRNSTISRYKPQYDLNKLEYKGFYSKSGKNTAIIRYNGKMNYVSIGDNVQDTVLIVNSIERSKVELKDNKTGDLHSIEK